jgi:hypothetical protein
VYDPASDRRVYRDDHQIGWLNVAGFSHIPWDRYYSQPVAFELSHRSAGCLYFVRADVGWQESLVSEVLAADPVGIVDSHNDLSELLQQIASVDCWD